VSVKRGVLISLHSVVHELGMLKWGKFLFCKCQSVDVPLTLPRERPVC
jgi:hypothetical protein